MILRLRHRVGCVSLLGLVCLLWGSGWTMAQPTPDPAHLILHMLDYVAVDYPEFVLERGVLDQAEYDEQVEFAQQVRATLEHLPAHADRATLMRAAEHLSARIQGKAPGLEVAALVQQLRWQVIRPYNIEVAPKRPPELHAAPALYQQHCAACHGPQGQGDGPVGVSLDPTPSNFHDRQRLDQRSVYGLYSTITLGVQGTGMSGFQTLSEDERWMLALYVSSFVSPPVDVQRGAELWQAGSWTQLVP